MRSVKGRPLGLSVEGNDPTQRRPGVNRHPVAAVVGQAVPTGRPPAADEPPCGSGQGGFLWP